MSATVATPLETTTAAKGQGIAFGAAWTLLALGAAAYLFVLVRVWASLPEMNDRFLIPLAAGWLIWRNRPRWRATPSSPSGTGLLFVALGAALAPPAWFLIVQVGPRVILLWWLLSAIVLAAFGLLVAQFGWRRAWQCAFPLAFCFLALPTPVVVQAPLQMQLKEYTTTATAYVLPALGIPAERRGHVLDLPSGELGVVDACSGVRSVTALTAIAFFVAYLRRFSVVRTAALIVLTMGIVVISNSVRVIVTGILQEKLGPKFTHGVAHDILGYTVILVGLGLIIAASSLLARRRPSGLDSNVAAVAESLPASRGASFAGGLAALLLAASIAGCVWAEQSRAAHLDNVVLARLPLQIEGWEGYDEPVAEAVADMLKCDQMIHRVYSGPLGQSVELYVMFWATPASTAHMHHPDICMPCQGWSIETSHIRPVKYAEDRPPLPVSIRTYRQKNRVQLVFYWTQVGNAILPDGPEDASQVSEYGWIGTMLRGDTDIGRTSRLSVRLDTALHGSPEHQEAVLAAVCSPMAREVYKLCPWATPE